MFLLPKMSIIQIQLMHFNVFFMYYYHLQELLLESGIFYNATSYVVDAVWALAHALNNCISTSNGRCTGSVGNFISNFSVNNEVSEQDSKNISSQLFLSEIASGQLHQW